MALGSVQADTISCDNFGSIPFFEHNDNSVILSCIQSATDEDLKEKFLNGNNLPMNAVVAGVDAEVLNTILSHYSKEDLEGVLTHQNFDELGIIPLSITSPNASRLILTLKTNGAELNVLKNKKEKTTFEKLKKTQGISALHLAIEKKVPFEVVLSLLAHGINPNIKDKKGNVALNYAAAKGTTYDILQLLLNFTKGVPKNDDGNTALHFAVQQNSNLDHINLFFKLTDKKFHKKTNEKDMTVLHSAATFADNPAVLSAVMEYSEEFMCDEDSKGAKAIEYAKRNENLSGTEQLLKLQNWCK